MKISNLFKKIRLIDILLAGGVIVLLLASYEILFRKADYLTVTVKVGDDSVIWPRLGIPVWYADVIKKGQVEKDAIGRNNVEILNVTKLSGYRDRSKRLMYVKLKLRSVYSKSSSSYTFNSKPVIVGNTVRIKPANILIEGLITNIEGMENPRKDKVINVDAQVFGTDPAFPNTTGVYPYVADAIKVGDSVYGDDAQPVITVREKKVESAKRVVITDRGESFVVPDPYKKDVFLNLEIRVKEYDGEYYLFDDMIVAINSSIPLYLKNLELYATVTKINNP